MDSTAARDEDTWWVACLCAAWCGVCTEWLPSFTGLARAFPQMRFAWVDVEDEDDAMGDVDIETFPTLLVARGGEVLFFGPVAPSTKQVERLLATLVAQPKAPSAPAADATALFGRLRSEVLPRTAV